MLNGFNDYVNVVVHVFQNNMRDIIDIEDFRGYAKVTAVEISSISKKNNGKKIITVKNQINTGYML